uniref:Tapasin-related protein-like n=1 Tax=Callorhinchus milii TaxID=7868 RepID=A0A4W3I7M7_CALMI|eukprot:gi/632965491/ref/XP_007898918.1/ PREDICTED: tapasin-related protein-like [Callorhinchus milii]
MILATLLLHLWILCSGSACAHNGRQRKWDCTFMEESSNDRTMFAPQIIRRKAFLVFGDMGAEDLQQEKAITFNVKESLLDIFRYVEGEASKLDCEIKRYSTHGIHVPWPEQDKELDRDLLNRWFTVTIKHTEDKFTTTSFLRKVPAPDSQQAADHGTKEDDENSTIGDTDTLLVKVVYIVRTSTPLIRAKLKQDVVLDCSYNIDHNADVIIEWRHEHERKKTKLFSYNGRHRQVEHLEKGVVAFEEQIRNGNASIRIQNLAVKDEGTYICSVYVPPLFGMSIVLLEIMESPIVQMNTEPLELMAGEEQKLTCEMARYYPLDVSVRWLRQWEGQRTLPDYLDNVVFSPHKRNADGTFNLTSFLRFRASLKDSGALYTCRVDHLSLMKTIKRSVSVKVKPQPPGLAVFLIGFCVIVLLAVLIGLLCYLSKSWERNKKKPY